MKILNVMLSKGVGGLEFVPINISEAMATEGVEVHNVIRANSLVEDHFKKRGLSYITCSARKLLDFSTVNVISNFIIEKKIDIVIAHGRRAIDFCAKVRVKPNLSNVVFVGWFHNDEDFGLGKMDKMDYVFILNEMQRVRLIENRFHCDKIIKVQNFLNLDKCQAPEGSFHKKDSIKNIGFISRMEKQKGLDILLQAVAELRRKGYNVRLKVGGAGELKDEMVKLSQSLGIYDSVDFLGYVSDLSSFFNNIDLFVNSSRTEPFGLNTTTAMYFGLPIVATPTGGSKEIITHKITGLLCDDFTHTSVANNIEFLLNNIDKAKELGMAAQEYCTNTYSSSALAPSTRWILEYVLAKHRGRLHSDTLLVKVIARGLVFNSKGELLVVSQDGRKWSLPGGTLDSDISLQQLCESEVFEETGLKVVAKDLVKQYEVSGVSKNGWHHGKYIDYTHGWRNIAFIYRCYISGNEELDPNWKDPAHDVIRFRKFVNEAELKDLNIWQNFLKDISFEALKANNL